jgi:hypothetical protein
MSRRPRTGSASSRPRLVARRGEGQAENDGVVARFTPQSRSGVVVNHVPGHQPIRRVNFYRWRSFDQWGIEAKPGMIADFSSALDPEYTWK